MPSVLGPGLVSHITTSCLWNECRLTVGYPTMCVGEGLSWETLGAAQLCPLSIGIILCSVSVLLGVECNLSALADLPQVSLPVGQLVSWVLMDG